MKREGFIAAIALALLASSAHAAGTASASFLKLGAGARAAGMGDAFSAVADDVTSVYWNPAGLAALRNVQVSAMHNAGLVSTQYQFLAAGFPVGDASAVGASVYRMDYGNIDRYSISDTKDGQFTAGDLAGALTYATRLSGGFSVGATAKFLQEKIDNTSASSFAGDAGVRWTNDRFMAAAVIQHVGPGMKFASETGKLPTTARAAVGARAGTKLIVDAEAAKPNDDKASYAAGAEYRPMEMFALRAGYSVTPGNSTGLGGLTGLSAGAGVSVGRLTLDYAVRPFGDLGISHRISLTAHFSGR